MSEPESNRQRRLREAVENLPEPFPTTRERGDSEQFSRHLSALRTRLDFLEHLEDRDGDEQKLLHRNRAERNALIFLLQRFADQALSAAVAAKGSERQVPNAAYVASMLDRAEELTAGGFTRVSRRRPGEALHKSGDDIAPLEIPVRVWAYLLGRQDAAGSAD